MQVLWALPHTFKKAVQRNYAKRVLRMLLLEILREETFFKDQEKGVLYLAILPRMEFFEQKYLEQKKELRNLVKKLSQKL